MKISISREAYDGARSVIEKFCGGTEFTGGLDKEVEYRSIFAVNFQKAMNDIDVADDESAEILNTFLSNIKDYKLPVKDIYDTVKINTFNMITLATYFNNICAHIGKVADTQLLYDIYTCLISSTNTSIMDMLYNINKSRINPKREFIKPIIEYSYIKKVNSFSSLLDVMRDFYDPNSNWHTKIYTDGVTLYNELTNRQLKNLVNTITASYINKQCILLKLNNNNFENDSILQFVKGLVYDNTWGINLFFYNNIYTNDTDELLNKLALDLYYYYADITNQYGHEDDNFNISAGLTHIDIDDVADITYKTFNYNLFLSAIKNENNIIDYGKEVLKVKQYINNIFALVDSSAKYTKGV